MKLGLAVLMIAVSAWGQGSPKPSHARGHVCYEETLDANWKPVDTAIVCPEDKPKPHKPKPSAKKEEFHWSCLGDCGGVPEGTTWETLRFNDDAILPQQPAKPAWVAPEYSVLDHVLQMDVLSQPDKAAAPVEHKCDQCDFGVEPFRTQIVSWPNGAFVTETEKQIVALLPTDEYSHLEQLRASVVEEEKRLAKKYGASVPDCSRFFGSRMYFNTPHGVSTSFTCMGPGIGDMRWPTFAIDDYQFHGQFLLIQKGKDPNVISLDDGDTK